MRSRELQALLSTMTRRTLSETDQRVRALRLASEIRSGPRGLSAPHMTMVEAAFHLLSMASRRAADAGEVQRRLTTECRYVPHPALPGYLAEGTPFATVLALYLDEPHRFGGSVEMAEDGSAAWIGKMLPDGTIQKLYFRDPSDDRAAAVDAGADYDLADQVFIGGRFVIGAASMVHIGNQVRVEAEAEDVPQMAKAG